MSEDYKVQISTKLGTNQAGMLNVRGNSVAEVDGLLRDAEDLLLPALAGFEERAKAVGLLAQAFPGTTGVAQQPTQPAQTAAAAQNGGGRTCAHGAMQWRSGMGNNGQAWQGWFCPSDRNDPTKCKPQWQR